MKKVISTLLSLILAIMMILPAAQPVSALSPSGWTSSSVDPSWLYGVWGSSATNVYAVGSTSGSSGGRILNYNGSTWTSMTTNAPDSTKRFFGVWGSAYNDIYAVGDGSMIQYFNGTQWGSSSYSATGTFIGVWGSDKDNVFVVGSGGRIFRKNGASWTSMTSPASDGLNSVWGTSASDIFAVGTGGVIVHYNGSAWSIMTSATTNDLYSVWGSANNDVYAVSLSGNFLHYDGSTWTDIKATANAGNKGLYGIWGSSASNIYAVGTGVLHFNGVSWSPVNSPIGFQNPERSVWGASSKVFVVGSNYMVYSFTPSTDATLSGLGISAGALSPSFAPATTTYTVNVANAVASVTVTPTVNETNASVKVNGNSVTSGSPSGAIPLNNIGANTITVVVTAQDGITTKTYNVTVNRATAPLTMTTSLLRPGIAGAAYSQTLAATGGTGPYNWSSVGALPANLSINATTGELHGTTSPAGTYSLTIQLNDTVNTVNRLFSIQLLASGNLYDWGYNAYGQLGNGESGTGGNTKDQYTQQAVHNVTNVVAMAAGYRHNLALDSQGNVWAWGDNSWGQLGVDPGACLIIQ